MLEQILSEASFVDAFNVAVFVAFTCCYSYQLYYVFVVLTRKPPLRVARANHRYAVMVSARNERAVIGDLVRSIRMQDYPAELVDVFVIADNCSDDTAQMARDAGAIVLERFDKAQVGKGYALDYGFKAIRERYAGRGYEAFFVFDADNVLDRGYFREMNAVFDDGAKVCTSYRNSKNGDANWIAAGYALWFLREARFLNQARLTLGTSCAISGTGFFVAADVLEETDGWIWHLLTEDIEFSAACIAKGLRISYCPTAVLYDEQPESFRDSWNQRFRWAKGFYQVFWHYGPRLVKAAVSGRQGSRFACFDMLMTVAPGMLLTVVAVAFNAVVVALGLAGVLSAESTMQASLASVGFCLCNYLLFMLLFGALTTIFEWDSIRSTPGRKVLHLFTFPLFMLTYVPIALVALVKKAEWKPIAHRVSVDVSAYASAVKPKG